VEMQGELTAGLSFRGLIAIDAPLGSPADHLPRFARLRGR
jgi:hypothetical protein